MMPVRSLFLGAVLAGLLGAGGLAQAQDAALPDPTRPPAILSAPARPDGLVPAASGPQVQSILVSLRPGGRRIAVIDGKTLREGSRLGDAVVEAIRPTEVVLRKGNQRQVLKLYRSAARVAAV